MTRPRCPRRTGQYALAALAYGVLACSAPSPHAAPPAGRDTAVAPSSGAEPTEDSTVAYRPEIVASGRDSTWRPFTSELWGFRVWLPPKGGLRVEGFVPAECFSGEEPGQPTAKRTEILESDDAGREMESVEVHVCPLPVDSIFPVAGFAHLESGGWVFGGEHADYTRMYADSAGRWRALEGSGIVRVYDETTGNFLAHDQGSRFVAVFPRGGRDALVFRAETGEPAFGALLDIITTVEPSPRKP